MTEAKDATTPDQSPTASGDAIRMRDVAIAALEDAKGQDIAVLDVTSLTDICDFMLVVTGTSDRHVKTLADHVLEDMAAAGWKKIGSEGEDDKDWVLVDFVDVVVHIMRAATRKRYDLESLWDRTFGELRKEGGGVAPDAGDGEALTAEDAASLLKSRSRTG